MNIRDLTDAEIARFIANYRRNQVEVGGKYALAELLLEQGRRSKSPFPPRQVAKVIVELATAASDGKATYKEVWSEFRPGEEWKGNASQTEIAQALGGVISYCARHGLPLVSTLVVRSDSRGHTAQAEQNIYNEARQLGIAVGLSAHAFVTEQAALSRSLVTAELPADD